MLLCIDIGNTAVTLGVFDGERLSTTLRVATDTRRLADEYGVLLTNLIRLKNIEPDEVDAACICSVVPPLTVVFEDVCKSFFGVNPVMVSVGTRTGLRILYDSPGTWVRTGSLTPWPLSNCTALRPSWWTSEPPPCSMQ